MPRLVGSDILETQVSVQRTDANLGHQANDLAPLGMTEFGGDWSKPRKVAFCRNLVKPPEGSIFF